MSPSSTFSSSLLVEQGGVIRAGLLRLGGWAIVALPLLLLVDVWYGTCSLTPLDRRMRHLAANLASTEILVLGNSRMEAAAIPTHLGAHALNMAGGSQDIYYDAQMVRKYAGRMPRLRVVVWGLDSFGFGFDLGRTEGEKRLVGHYDRYFPRRALHGVRDFLESRLNLLRYRGADPVRLFTLLVQGTHAGSADLPAPHVARDGIEDVSGGRDRANRHLAIYFQPAIQKANFALMAETVDALKRAGVRVILVSPPVAATYRGAESRAIREPFLAYRQRLLAQTGVEYLDLEAAFPTGQGLFRDSDHLQRAGAERFSRILADVIARTP